MMNERTDADKLAEQLLGEPHADPDDDLRVLSRQLLRRNEVIERLKRDLMNRHDPLADMIHANRDEMLQRHEEAARLICGMLTGGGPDHDHEKLIYIGKVLYALNTFHPMHAEDWIGWPTS